MQGEVRKGIRTRTVREERGLPRIGHTSLEARTALAFRLLAETWDRRRLCWQAKGWVTACATARNRVHGLGVLS